MQGCVDHRLPRPHVVDFLASNAAEFTPSLECFISWFVTNVLQSELLLSAIILLHKFLRGIGQILRQVHEVSEPAELVTDDRALRHPVDVQSDFDQTLPNLFDFVFVKSADGLIGWWCCEQRHAMVRKKSSSTASGLVPFLFLTLA